MKRSIAVVAATMLLGSVAYAYQVTGPVLEVTDSKIVVEKDKERWELARDKETKGATNIKKGDRVTIQYRMTATEIEAKNAKGTDAKGKDAKAPVKK
jgi:FKBP-type peptidyl-prolyl cis-trans isomerase (trigger factor)